MSRMKAKFIQYDQNSLQANGDELQVKVKSANPITIEAVNGIALQTQSVDDTYIKDEAVTEAKLQVSNTPSNGQILSYDTTLQKFVWLTAPNTDAKDVKVSANDSTASYLSSKITGVLGKVTVTEINDSGNETLQINTGADIFDKTVDTASDVPYGASDVGSTLDTLSSDKADDSGVVHKTGNESIAGNKTFSGDTIFSGDVTINGTTTTVNSQTVSTGDNIIELNNDMISGTPTEDGGITVLRGDETSASLKWNESTDKWEVGLEGTEVGISLEGHTHTKSNITDFTETDYVHSTGSESVSGVKTFNSIPVLPGSDPTSDNQAARKAYVDSKIEQKKVEIRTLAAGDITAKQLTLANTPKNVAAVQLIPQGGCEQIYGDDFSVTGNTLSWNGLGLDGLLAASDKLIISYHF